MKKILLLLAVFMQAMSMSVSARDFLIKTEWGQTELNSLLPKFEDGTPVFSGCTTVAAAQVINYYGFLPSYDFTFAIDVATKGVNSFPGGTEETILSGYSVYSGSFHSPGMPTTPDSLMATIFYSQANQIETSGTSTSPYSLYGCFSNHYSYDIDAYVTDEYADADEAIFCKKVTTDEQKEIVKKAIAAEHPVIVNGRGHTFIIDGYDAETDEFHFNLGWGPDRNFWGTYRSWSDGRYSIFIPTPNKNKITMPEITDEDHIAFHMRNVDTGEENIGYLQYAYGTAYTVKSDSQFEIGVKPGTYEIWFVMKDGSILAPALPANKKMFADKQDSFVAYNFIDHPAIFIIDDADSLNYVLQTNVGYDTQMGYICIMMTEIIPEEVYLKADIDVVCNGETYKLTNHNNRSMRTEPIEVKTDTVVEYVSYYNGIPFGKTYDSHYQSENIIEEDNFVIMIQPAEFAADPESYKAIKTDDTGERIACQSSQKALYGSTNPFNVRIPSKTIYLNKSSNPFKGDISSLEKINPETVLIGFDIDTYGVKLFLYNDLPDNLAGIENIQLSNDNADGKIYSVTGQRLNAPAKGINIIGGKKVLMK